MKKKSVKQEKGSVLINVVLDRSGSMTSRVVDTIGGYNTYINELKKDTKTNYKLSLMQFDNEFIKSYVAVDLASVPELTEKTYIPRGSTALLDAIGYAVTAVEKTNADKVITVIITDGEENSSKEYTKKVIKDLITRKESEGNWTFVFLGADLSAFTVGDSIGVSTSNSVAYNAANVGAVYANTAMATMKFVKSLESRTQDFYSHGDEETFRSGGMTRRKS